jgi:hypothetical protein
MRRRGTRCHTMLLALASLLFLTLPQLAARGSGQTTPATVHIGQPLREGWNELSDVTPSARTLAASHDAASGTITLNAVVNPNGNDTTVRFEYGATTAYGTVVDGPALRGISDQRVSASIRVRNGQPIHYRVVATTGAVTSYGIDVLDAPGLAARCPGAPPAPIDQTSKIEIVATCSDDLQYASFNLTNRNDFAVDVDYFSGGLYGSISLQPLITQKLAVYRYSVTTFVYNSTIWEQIATNDQSCNEAPNPRTNIFVYREGYLPYQGDQIYQFQNNNTVDTAIAVNAGVNQYYFTLPAYSVQELLFENTGLEVLYNSTTFLVVSPTEVVWPGAYDVTTTPVCSTSDKSTIDLQNNIQDERFIRLEGNTTLGETIDHTYALSACQTIRVEVEKIAWDVWHGYLVGYLTPSATPCEEAPTITSADATTFAVGSSGSFTVTATGTPAPSLSMTGTLPSGVTFDTATGVLSGTPIAGTGGVYSLAFTASNGVSPNAAQPFTLTVNQAPAITSANAASFTVGRSGSFTVTATGYPAPTLSESGALPSGVAFNPTTRVLSGTPAAGTGGSRQLSFTAANGVSPNAVQSFALTVLPTAQTSLTLVCSNNPAPSGKPVRFTARVSFYSRALGIPTGTVQFKVGTAILGTPVPLVSAQASSQSVTLPASGSPYKVTATYSGDGNFATSTATVQQTILP